MTKEIQSPQVNMTPAKVEFDFEPYRAELERYIAGFDVVVTEDTLAESKKAATELNKLSASIKSGFKKHVDELKQPANELNDHSKTLIQMCQDGRSKITEQVEKFESVKREKCHELMVEHLAIIRDELGVRGEYRTGTIDSLVKLTATNKENTALTKQAKTDVEAIAKDERALQNQTDSRLNGIKAMSIDAGLDAPLERRHVETFLFASDAEYDANVKSIIDAELERQRVADERRKQQQEKREQEIKEQAERDARANYEREQAQKRQKEEAQRQSEQIEQTPLVSDEVKQRAAHAVEPKPAAQGKKVVSVLARFDIAVPGHIDSQLVANKVLSELESLGKKPTSVEVL